MRTLFLHAGPAKTGSSTLQAFLFANTGVLREAGFHVPAVHRPHEKGNHSHLLAELGLPLPAPFIPPRSLAAELEDAGWPPAVILSAEAYGTHLGNAAFAAGLIAHAAKLGYALRTLHYVRPQVPLANSHYVQAVKMLRPTPPFEVFLAPWRLGGAGANHLQRLRRLEALGLAAAFIPLNGDVRAAGLGQDFLRRLGVAETAIRRCQAVADQNESLGRKAVAALWAIAAARHDAIAAADPERVSAIAGELHRLIAARNGPDQRFDGFDAASRQAVTAAYAASNESFARAAWKRNWTGMFGADEARLLAAPQSVYRRDESDPDERADFDDFVAGGTAFVTDLLRQGQKP